MAQMSMNKVIHAAVRRDLDRFVSATEGFEPGDRPRAGELNVAWDNFHAQLTHHHEGEHEIAWPAIEEVGVPREVLVQMDAEHEAMAAALDRAATALRRLQTDPSAEQQAATHASMRELRAVTNEHLDHEEREIEPIYLEQHDSAPLKEMGKEFARAQGPAQAGRYFAWLSDGATPEHRQALTDNVPGPLVAILSGLFGRGYRRTVAPVWR